MVSLTYVPKYTFSNTRLSTLNMLIDFMFSQIFCFLLGNKFDIKYLRCNLELLGLKPIISNFSLQKKKWHWASHLPMNGHEQWVSSHSNERRAVKMIVPRAAVMSYNFYYLTKDKEGEREKGSLTVLSQSLN